MDDNKRILIFSGGSLGNWALQGIKPDDILIGVDRGAWFLIQNGLQPAYSLGDFDSVSNEELTSIQHLSQAMFSCDPIDKDLTDTEMAVKWALEQNPQELVLLGVTGSRLDHSLANIHLLHKALLSGVSCRIIDEKNEIRLVNNRLEIKKGKFPYVSLLPLTMQVTGITLTGFQYPLQRATIAVGDSIGISNVILGSTGLVEIETGLLLVIQSMD